jgi:hypothetical protein
MHLCTCVSEEGGDGEDLWCRRGGLEDAGGGVVTVIRVMCVLLFIINR